MADNRKPYTVKVNGIEHTLLLDAEEAKRYGEDAVEVKQAGQPANKSRTVQDK